MTWGLSTEKEAGIQDIIDKFLKKNTSTLLEAQKLHGKLSEFSLSCEFMLGSVSILWNYSQNSVQRRDPN
jgi:hypothetical protein